MKIIFFSFVFLISFASVKGQYYEYPFFNFSLVPGLGTSGLDPGNVYSNISLNVFSGYQRGTYWLEFSGISSVNIDRTFGLQISGVANLTGVNLYQGIEPKNIKKEIAKGNYAELNGFQFSGLMNYVRGDATGSQVSAGINISQKMMAGVQISGLANYSSVLLTGVQFSLISNVSSGSTLGMQASTLVNFTKYQLSGFQIGAINAAETIEGKNSLMDDHSTAIQIGIVNRAKTMNGFQIGLINFGGDCRGTQIGLINIYSTPYKTGKLYGTPIAPLNFDANADFRIYYDETFPFNLALGTGNSKNSAIVQRTRTKYIMNHVLYRRSNFGKSDYHAFGWTFEEDLYNHVMDPGSPNDELYFVGAGVGISNLFFKDEGAKLNLLGELNITAGSRIIPKVRSLYIIGFIDLNYFCNNNGKSIAPENYSKKFTDENTSSVREIWPGYGIGIQLK